MGTEAAVDMLGGDSKYETVRPLGAGAYGRVIQAKNRVTGEFFAIKFVPRGPSHITKNVLRELMTHSSLCHPHVVLFKEAFLTPTHLGIVLEYAPGGDLYKYCCDKGYISEVQSRKFMQQIVVALDYVHKMGVVNRDIKLENTLLDESKRLVKLTDFGFAKGPDDSLPHSNVGTPNYAAPEVISGTPQYDGKLADVWSCGVLLMTMLFHQYPFERPNDPKGPIAYKLITARTKKADYVIPDKPEISPECKDFIQKCLQADPAKRISVEEIYDHPWFKIGFPASARTLNENCLKRQILSSQAQKLQEDIKFIVEKARQAPGEAKRGRRDFDLDREVERQLAQVMMAL